MTYLVDRPTATRRGLSCPICEHDHGCELEPTGWVKCLRATSDVQNCNPQAYRFHSLMRGGMGGLFKPRCADPEAQLRNAEVRAQKIREESIALLPTGERASQFSQLFTSLSLSVDHAAYLNKRGLTDLTPFRTWKHNTSLPQKLSPRLPGLTTDGDRLHTIGYGILVPAMAPNGWILGGQIRRTEPWITNRYKWLSSPLRHGISRLRNGELPLFCAIQQDSVPSELWLCEGSLKPFIASQRYGINCIGAAGNLWPQQITTEYIKYLKPAKIIIAPDAGAVINSGNIVPQTYQLVRLLQSLGYEPQIAWWDQHTKESPDIDELSEEEFRKLRLITWSSFFDRCDDRNKHIIDNSYEYCC